MKNLYKLLIIVSIFSISHFANAQVIPAFDASSTGNCVACTGTLTVSHNIGTNSNSLLMVGVSISNAGSGAYLPLPITSAVTYNGVAMTLATSSRFTLTGTGLREDMGWWYLFSTTTGAKNIIVTSDASTSQQRVEVIGASFTSVNQTSPIRSLTGAITKQASGAQSATSISSQVGDLVLSQVCNGTSITNSLQTAIAIANVTNATACGNQGMSYLAGTTTTTMTWNVNSGDNSVNSVLSIVGFTTPIGNAICKIKLYTIFKRYTMCK